MWNNGRALCWAAVTVVLCVCVDDSWLLQQEYALLGVLGLGE